MNKCLYCDADLFNLSNKFCSNLCQSNQTYKTYISDWKRGEVNGMRGIRTKNMSGHIVRYINEKYSGICARCGWHVVNISTGKTTLEIDHIDGNSDNNIEDNLVLLCPNCHSLTPTYKNLNNGSGRVWRRKKM